MQARPRSWKRQSALCPWLRAKYAVLEIISPEDAARLAAVKATLLVPGQVQTGEWTYIRKDGTSFPAEVSSNILPEGCWQAFARDITERKRVEDERQIFVSLLANSSDFIGIADPTGKPVYVNPAGRRMIGLSADYPIEQTRIADYYPGEERAFVEQVIVKTTVERGRWSGETNFRHWQTGAATRNSRFRFPKLNVVGSNPISRSPETPLRRRALTSSRRLSIVRA